MKEPPPGQLPFELPETAPARRRRSKRLRMPSLARGESVAKAKPPPEGMLQSPVARRCGFCGHKLTVLEDATLCPACGSIVTRSEEEQ